jgi:tetratricopeptide (TPR) repeat protein
MPAAAGLLNRALLVLPSEDERRTDLRLALADALSEIDLEAADGILDVVIADAVASGDEGTEWQARLMRGWVQLSGQQLSVEEADKLVEKGLEVLTRLGHDAGLTRAWRLRAHAANMEGYVTLVGTSMRSAAVHGSRAGEVRLATESDFWTGFAAYFGETPLHEAWAIWEEIDSRAGTPLQQTHASFWRGCLEGLAGNLETGIATVARARLRYAELGNRAFYGGSANPHAELELLADDPAAAEKTLRGGLAELEQLGDRAYSSTLLAQLTEALYEQGRLEEAAAALEKAESLSAPDDALNNAWFPLLRAMILAHRGELIEAESLARKGIVTSLSLKGHITQVARAHGTLAKVLRLTGRTAESREEAERALELYERKGNVPAADKVRSFLAELVAT